MVIMYLGFLSPFVVAGYAVLIPIVTGIPMMLYYARIEKFGMLTIAGVDQIYVIEDGQITESGKSRELLEKGGVFSHMWQDYQTSVQWKVAKEVQ